MNLNLPPGARLYLSQIGRKGGLKSRRVLDSKTAKEMTAVRDAKRAFRKFYVQCFWSYDPQLALSKSDIRWVVEELKKQGGREAWKVAARLCL